ncbi:MAG TPA: DNA-3-methyladenine glycosylase 2 family protein [Candidatus Bathyarchaeia archaeon]|nr:DNA-3-methyladenine glycosylase 2 family protein [Candidatus Bathyarchaeia archaeon]
MTQKLADANLAQKEVWTRGMKHLKKNDLALAKIIKRLGPYEFHLDDDDYEALVGSIIFQQLAGAAARAILNRFKQIYDGKIPRPRQYLETKERYLRASGLSPQKIRYIRDLSERIENGVLDLKRLSDLPSDEVVKELDKVKGIGRWTAEMFLIFVLGRTDVLPVDDLGLRKAAQKIYRLRNLPTREKFEQLSKKWHPYCSIATLYLWRSQEKPQDPIKW